MPSIWSFTRGAVTGMDLNANAYWRLRLGAGYAAPSSWLLGVVLIYPPTPMAPDTDRSCIILASTTVPMAEDADTIKKLAAVCLEGGSEDKDHARCEEAFQMFKYGDSAAKLKGDVLASTISDVKKVITLYWRIRDWLESGKAERAELKDIVPDTKIICIP